MSEDAPRSPDAHAATGDGFGARLVRSGRYAWALVGLIVATGLVVLGVLKASVVVVPLLLATFPAAVLAPLVRRLRDRGWGRNTSAGLVFAGGIAVAAGIITILVMEVSGQLPDVVPRIQDGYEQLRNRFDGGPINLPALDAGTLSSAGSSGGAGSAGNQGQPAIAALRSAFHFLAQFALTLVIVFFFLRDGDRIGHWLRSLVPTAHRDEAQEVGERISSTVGEYIRGQAIIATFDAALIGAGLFILGVPLAGALTAITFLASFIPIAGAFASGAAAVLIALAASGITQALIVLAIVVAVQQIEGNVLAPVVLGRSVDLHPLAILIGLTLGGFLFGVIGAIVAVPITASLHRAVSHLADRSDLWSPTQESP